jgi:hypoxanthine phosphoribosyltransferase
MAGSGERAAPPERDTGRMTMLAHLDEVRETAELLYSCAEVESAICRVADELTEALSGTNPVVVTVLDGGIIFCGKLLPLLDFPLQLDSVSVSRYRGETQGSTLQWRLQPKTPLAGRTVVLVDDVLDEGHTLAELRHYCIEQGAAAVLIAVLVEKRLPRAKPCRADFIGLEADDRYLFGYGMDYRNYLRNAAGIYACTHL